ncbi:chaplin family protein [Streptomyces sp. NPDC051987]|uniref:chaplin n=1 Tax=Streptomyces sp. NPDC051987 TaxID=3155808 RepID=UPI003416B8A2
MRQTLSRGMVAAAAATSILSLYGSPAFADSEATGIGGGSPGVLSGNNVQAPVSVPVNVCGNSVDAAAALNPAFGNSCANPSHPDQHVRTHGSPYGGLAHDDMAYGDTGHHDSAYGDLDHRDLGHYGDLGRGNSGYGGPGYGVDSPPGPRETPGPYGEVPPPGYGHETPPGYGHETPPGYGGDNSPPCHDTPPSQPTPPGRTTPPGHSTPPEHSTPPRQTAPPVGGHDHGVPPSLAHTGTGAMLATSAASAALIAGGTILYRRGRAASRRP